MLNPAAEHKEQMRLLFGELGVWKEKGETKRDRNIYIYRERETDIEMGINAVNC